MTGIKARLVRPVDAASLAAFRIGFGVLMLALVARFFAHGWIHEYFAVPAYFFKYWGFEWVRPWPGDWMYLHFALMGLCALGIALGYQYRASVIGFGVSFAYAHLIDQTNYLNHYYLVVCLCALMAWLPLHGMWSLDARRKPGLRRELLPTWALWALRAQFGLVYCFGGIAKLKPDWLLDAEPLSIWLSRNSDFPLLGALFTQPAVALGFSWAGVLFDLSIVPLLLWHRTRPLAYLAVLAFHLVTARLFQLGMFPYIMSFGSLLFLEPGWPRWLLARLSGSGPQQITRLGVVRSAAAVPAPASWLPRYALPLLAGYFVVQLLVPLRHLLYPGDVCWTEQGYRFSWNVMLTEKNGSVDFRIVEPSTGRSYRASALDYFTRYQTKMMAPQPDLVLQAARIVAADFRARGVAEPQVFVDAFASLNGRPMQRLIDPRVDLARELDGLAPKSWILPLKSAQLDALALDRSQE